MALVADVDTVLQTVRLTYDVPANTTHVTITRTGPSGEAAIVRGFDYEPLGVGQVVARDFEAPIAVALSYVAQSFNAADAVIDTKTASVTIASTGCADTWLNDLARVGNTMQVIMESLPALDYPVPTSVHEVIARRDPIVTSDVAHTPGFELSILTETDDDRERARAILGNGVPVLLRTPPANGVGNLYFSVLGFAEQRIVTQATVADRRFVINARQVARPDPALYHPVGFVDYAYVRDTFATYSALRSSRVNYDAMLYDWAGQEPSDIIPWPPDDV